MYEAFRDFCKRPTWDTFHPSDMRVFKQALNNSIRQDGFSPEEIGAYIRANHADPIWPKSEVELNKVIGDLVKEAKKAAARISNFK